MTAVPSARSSARLVEIRDAPETFSLAETCGPVAWGGGRWPNVDWIDGALVWVGWEGDRVVWRRACQVSAGLAIEGSGVPERDEAWAAAVLGIARACPTFGDPVIAGLRGRYPGLHGFAYGSLFDGLVSSIVGQSISVASAAVTGRRLAALFADEVPVAGRSFWPLPRPDLLAGATAALVRSSGVTWRRAEALIAAGRSFADGAFDPDRVSGPDEIRRALRALPLVGPWTAESALLWGVGEADAYPVRDVALLRSARLAYGRVDLNHRDLERLADGWHPSRGWASRLLWTGLLGAAPDEPTCPAGSAPFERDGQ